MASNPTRNTTLKSGLRYYLNGETIGAMHVLIPFIEDTLRYLLKSNGNLTLKKQNNVGGYDEKLLEHLLADPNLIDVLGKDTRFYYRVLFTERRGFNFRNDCTHGLMCPSKFSMENTDLVFHALLILASLKL